MALEGNPTLSKELTRAALACGVLLGCAALAAEPLALWHGATGAQAKGLAKAAEAFTAKTGLAVELRALAADALAEQLPGALAGAQGPDVAVLPAEALGPLALQGLLAPLEGHLEAAAYLPTAVEALRRGGAAYGFPLSVRVLALYRNPRLAPLAPQSTQALEVLLRGAADPAKGRYGLTYDERDAHVHQAILAGFGGSLLDANGKVQLDTPQFAASVAWIKRLQDEHLMPRKGTTQLALSLFSAQQVAFVIAGPAFAAELDAQVPFDVSLLPVVSATGKPMRPTLGVDGAVVSARSSQRESALKLAAFLSRGAGASERARVGMELTADLDSRTAVSPALEAFRSAASGAEFNPDSPAMARVWAPLRSALSAALEGSCAPAEAGALAQRRFLESDPSAPPRRWPFGVALALAAAAAALAWRARRQRPTR